MIESVEKGVAVLDVQREFLTDFATCMQSSNKKKVDQCPEAETKEQIHSIC